MECIGNKNMASKQKYFIGVTDWGITVYICYRETEEIHDYILFLLIPSDCP